MAKNETPLEIKEQATVIRWLDERGIKLFTGTAQSTFTNFKGLAQNKKAGVRKGLPDVIICLPNDQTNSGKDILVFIEMKRTKGGTLGPEQEQWINFINRSGNYGFVAYGALEAINFLKSFLKPKVEDTRPIEEQEWLKNQ